MSQLHLKRSIRLVGAGLVVLVALLPRTAHAQSATSGSIGGEVRDVSGGVLPGVTVEASSPALIERVRAAVTDGQGRTPSSTSDPVSIRSPSRSQVSILSNAKGSS